MSAKRLAKHTHSLIKKRLAFPWWVGEINLHDDIELEEIVRDSDIDSLRIY